MIQSSCKRDTKSQSYRGMKLAPVRIFSCKHPLSRTICTTVVVSDWCITNLAHNWWVSIQSIVGIVRGRNWPLSGPLRWKSGRFPFSPNFRKFRFGRKWKTFRRFVPLVRPVISVGIFRTEFRVPFTRFSYFIPVSIVTYLAAILVSHQ